MVLCKLKSRLICCVLIWTGSSSVEAAINWIVEHENDADVDEVPMVCFLSNSIVLIINLVSLQS